MDNGIKARFMNLNFDTKPSTVKQETVYVTVNPEMFNDYADAYVAEARRINPVAFEELHLTSDELRDYFLYLLICRLESLSPNGCPEWRKLKACYIPDFFQFVLSQIGVYIDQTHGLKFIPKYDGQKPNINYLEISGKIEFYTRFGLAATKDSMPRGNDGDPDTMGFVILGDYVYGRNEIQAPLCSYVAAFLGLKLSEEATFKMLYRVRYDDVEFIKDMLINERSIYG